MNALMTHSAFLTHRVIKMNHLCAELALRMHLPVIALAPREVVVNVQLANHASPARLAQVKTLPCRLINQSPLQVPFSVERALEMQPRPANMRVQGESTSDTLLFICILVLVF